MPTRVSIYHDPSVVPLDPRTRKPISMEEYLYGEATWDEHRQAWVPENGQRDAVASKLGAGWTFDEYYHAFFASKPADAAALEAPAVEMLENAGLDQEPDVRSSPSERGMCSCCPGRTMSHMDRCASCARMLNGIEAAIHHHMVGGGGRPDANHVYAFILETVMAFGKKRDGG
jgi:hypothetical protein